MGDTDLTEIATTIQAAWTRAFATRDLAALADLYAPDVQFWGSTAELYLSRAGVAAYFTTLPASYKAARYDRPHVLAIGPDAFCASGNVVFVRDGADGPVGLPFRMTQVFVRRSGEWTITLHHASPVPDGGIVAIGAC